jgi:hypothetical protein
VRCWFAPHDVQGGKKLHEQIDQAIRIYDKLLLILSEDSMNSEWVKTEIANARHFRVRLEVWGDNLENSSIEVEFISIPDEVR